MCCCLSFVSFFDGFVVLLLGNLFVEGCYVDGVWAYFLEALAVCRCAVDTSFRAKGCVLDIKALFYAFGGARCTFVLFLGCRFRGELCRGVLGFFFISACS